MLVLPVHQSVRIKSNLCEPLPLFIVNNTDKINFFLFPSHTQSQILILWLSTNTRSSYRYEINSRELVLCIYILKVKLEMPPKVKFAWHFPL